MKWYIFPIIKKKKEEEEKKDKRLPLYKRNAFDIEPYPQDRPINTNDKYEIDFNIDEQENIINNDLRL